MLDFPMGLAMGLAVNASHEQPRRRKHEPWPVTASQKARTPIPAEYEEDMPVDDSPQPTPLPPDRWMA